MDKRPVHERTRLRERGRELNILEEFLRGDGRLAVISGGLGSGKTTIVEHLLSTRAYEKSPIVIDGRVSTDLWSFLESFFSQAGLRLAPERLSLLTTLSWQHAEVPWRQFVNKYASRIILCIDNFDGITNSNGAFENDALGRAISLFSEARGAKIVLSQRQKPLPASLLDASQTQLPPEVYVGRFATPQTVINILDDHFSRASHGIAEYPTILIDAIDRYPLTATLAADILKKEGRKILTDQKWIDQLRNRLRRELWERLVDEAFEDAMAKIRPSRISALEIQKLDQYWAAYNPAQAQDG